MVTVTWTETADVIVVGLGIAGLTAAISAADAGANVVILEKMSSHLAGGASRSAGNMLLLPDDEAGISDYQRALNDPNPVPEDVLAAFSRGRVALEPWLRGLVEEVGAGIEWLPNTASMIEYPDFPGTESLRFAVVPPVPTGLWDAFMRQAARREIAIRYETPAVDLVQDAETLDMHGVVTPAGAVRARRAVILCCGGYEHNLTMQRDYFGVAAYALSSPANTGDGLILLQRAGASLWHLRTPNQTGGFLPAIPVPEYETPFFRNISFDGKSWIDIGRDSQRFWAEGRPKVFNHYRQLVHGAWVDSPLAAVMPVHTILDAAALRQSRFASGVFGWNTARLGYQWSADNAAEVDRGWIPRAPSIRDLAARIQRDPDTLEATVNRFNAQADAGHDDDFGRDPASMRPIVEPPFAAVRIVPAVVSTTGGGRRDAEARVLATSGDPIPRLYEAGQLGSTQSNLYQGGTFLTEALVFGRIAGANAAAEPTR